MLLGRAAALVPRINWSNLRFFRDRSVDRLSASVFSSAVWLAKYVAVSAFVAGFFTCCISVAVAAGAFAPHPVLSRPRASGPQAKKSRKKLIAIGQRPTHFDPPISILRIYSPRIEKHKL